MGKLQYDDGCAVCGRRKVVELFDHKCKSGDILCLGYCNDCIKTRENDACKYCKELIKTDQHWYMNKRHYECEELRASREYDGKCIKCGEESPLRYCAKHGNGSQWVGYGIKTKRKKKSSK